MIPTLSVLAGLALILAARRLGRPMPDPMHPILRRAPEHDEQRRRQTPYARIRHPELVLAREVRRAR